jgi:hypothetical protein
LRNDPTRSACDAEARANDVLARIEGNGAAPSAPATPKADAPQDGAKADSSSADEFVDKQVRELMAKVTPPEERLRFDTEKSEQS